MNDPVDELAQLATQGLLRSLRPLGSATGPQVIRENRELHNFASNDYLGLASHPALAGAWIEGITRYGSGSAASRLVSGTLPPHETLEAELAEAKSAEAALVFSSGFATAVGGIPSIVGAKDTVIVDKLCHASLIDGAKLSGATLRVFPHNDLGKLRRLLVSLRAKNASGRVLVVTESIFSMDGDVCPLRELVEIVEEFGALLWLDEAHSFGVLGNTGMGLAETLGVQNRVTFQMGTFSKAAGLSGGYVASSRPWIDLMVNRARAFIYSTAPPPALAHATLASLRLIRSKEGAMLREALRRNIDLLAADHPSAIIPVILGSNESALQASRELDSEGYLIPAIRYPTVPRGHARLRVSLSAAHDSETINSLNKFLARLRS